MSFGFQGVFLIPPAPLKGGRAKRRGCKAQPTCQPHCPAGPAPGRLPPFKGVPKGGGLKNSPQSYLISAKTHATSSFVKSILKM